MHTPHFPTLSQFGSDLMIQFGAGIHWETELTESGYVFALMAGAHALRQIIPTAAENGIRETTTMKCSQRAREV